MLACGNRATPRNHCNFSTPHARPAREPQEAARLRSGRHRLSAEPGEDGEDEPSDAQSRMRGMMQDFFREVLRDRDYSNMNESVYPPDKLFKNASRHLFVSNVLIRYARNGFTNFESAFQLAQRALDTMIAIRNRESEHEIVIKVMRELEEETSALKNYYCEESTVDHRLYVWLDEFLEELILDNLKSPVT